MSAAGTLNGLANLLSSGKILPSEVYLPDLDMLTSEPGANAPPVGVGYTANPAPMGISDIGVGVSRYAYNTSHFEGSLTLNAANATYPGAYYYIQPGVSGYYNSPYYFGIQLNTVTTNISIPGSTNGAFWTQNVVTLNGAKLSFIDNVWNFTSPTLALNPGTLYSYNGTPEYPTYYFDRGPTITLTFPVTIDLYNNVSVVGGRDQVEFGYRVVDSAGTFTGVYDTVVFNSPSAPTKTPGFEVSGKYRTPARLDYDSELIFGGPGGGSNSDFNNISGTETLQYSNESSGGWKSVPSAYDFGADTGETAIGVAETWSPGGTVGLSAGPSLLYGLWNSQPSTAAASGSIEVQGTLSPSYGFVFIGDATTAITNISWVPTNAAGGFLTYLPPVTGSFPFGTYIIFGVADGYAWAGYATFTTKSVGVAVTLSTLSPGQDSEPIYVNGNAQAQAAATAIMAWTTGPFVFAGTFLNGLSSGISTGLLFDKINDAGYETFNLFQATGVSDVINDSGLYQGDNDAYYLGANYYQEDAPPTGHAITLLGIPPTYTFNVSDYGQQIAFFSDTNVKVYDQALYGIFAGQSFDAAGVRYNANPVGGDVVLWNDPAANASDVESFYGSYGVWAAASPNLQGYDLIGIDGAAGVTLAGGSNDAKIHLSVGIASIEWTNHYGIGYEVPFGVLDFDAVGGTFTDMGGLGGGIGLGDIGGVGATVNYDWSEFPTVNITSSPLPSNPIFPLWYSYGVSLAGAVGTSINDTQSYVESGGVSDGLFGPGSLGTTITNLTDEFSYDYTYGFVLYGSDWTNLTNVVLDDSYFAGFLDDTQHTSFVNTSIFDDYYGIIGGYTGNTSFTETHISYIEYLGIWLEYDVNSTTFTDLNASYDIYGAGVGLEYANGVTLDDVVGYGAIAVIVDGGVDVTANTITGTYYIYNEEDLYDFAVQLWDGSGATITNVVAEEDSGGVYLESWDHATITTVSTATDGIGVEVDPSTDVTISGVISTTDSEGVELDATTDFTVTNVAASVGSLGVFVGDSSSQGSITTVSSTGLSLGVAVIESSDVQVSTVTVANSSIGVFAGGSQFLTITGVTATNTTLQPTWENYDFWGLPIAAVVTEESEAITVTDVTATNYPIALYDEYSDGLQVSALNASFCDIGLVLNATYNSLFTGIGAYRDWQGVQMNAYYGEYADDNTITLSSFVNDTSYGVAILDGWYNTVYDNNFIGDNGATATYSPAHIQAFAGQYNYFDVYTGTGSGGIGNYWADWHTYGSNGYLAPYLVSGETWDYYPIGPQETFTVSFAETGLASGTSWSVTLNGVTQTGTTATLNFTEPMGTYAYQVGSVTGYNVTPSSGSVTLSAAAYTVQVTYTAIPPTKYAITLSAGGLSSGTTWSATVNGVTQSTSGTSLVFYLVDGTYTYSFNAVSGYNLGTPSSGSVTVAGAPVSLGVTYSPVSTPSYVQTNTFNDWFAIALALAVIALVIGLVALFLRRGKESPPPTTGAPQPWTPPPAAGGGGTTPPAGGSTSWSEGPPSGGAPPS